MKLRYLPTAEPVARWFRSYYRKNTQLDRAKVISALARAEATLVEFPLAGAAYEDFENVREYGVAGTPFSLLYAIARQSVLIIDIRDRRGRRSAEALRRFLDVSGK